MHGFELPWHWNIHLVQFTCRYSAFLRYTSFSFNRRLLSHFCWRKGSMPSLPRRARTLDLIRPGEVDLYFNWSVTAWSSSPDHFWSKVLAELGRGQPSSGGKASYRIHGNDKHSKVYLRTTLQNSPPYHINFLLVGPIYMYIHNIIIICYISLSPRHMDHLLRSVSF